MTSDHLLVLELADAMGSGIPVALATVVSTRQSVPRHAGTKMLIYADGRQSGTIGGGEMELRVISEARSALIDGRARLLPFALVDPASGDPGVCGGELQIFVEPYMPVPTVYVIGCGHVGKAVVELAHWLGYRVVATDDRIDMATTDQIPLADVVIAGDISRALAEAPITSETHVVILTRNVAVDLEILPVLLATPARSIGVMGSKRRWTTTREALRERGVTEEQLSRVVTPVGLELHAETPEEIAVSVMAQLVEWRRGPLGSTGGEHA